MRTIYTICSLSNIAQAAVMFESVEDEIDKVLFLVDEKRDLGTALFNFEIVLVKDVIPEIHAKLIVQYNAFELCCALKPILGKYLIEKRNIEQVVYADTDLFFYYPLGEFLDQQQAEFLLTPHFTSSPADYEKISEIEINKSGLYNGGFFVFKSGQLANNILDWWSTKTLEVGFNDIANGMFVDQIWLNFLPVYFDGVEICKDPTVNMAYWNLHERSLDGSSGNLTINGKPLLCFHFSGFKLARPDLMSIHQEKYSFENSPGLTNLFKNYYALWKNSQHSKYNGYEYSYSSESISEKMKRKIRAGAGKFLRRETL